MKRTTLGLPLLAMAFSGCITSNADVELLEARLRDQQDLVSRYEKSLKDNQQELSIARKESRQLREQLASAGKPVLLPEHADVLLRAEKLAFHTMMTGARDLDGRPGEERLHVVLVPQSNAGETVRLIGAIEIEAVDLTRPSGQQSLGRWTFTPEQAREHWHNGFLASGLQFELPWAELPQSSDVVLNARLVAPDGRRLAASHKITVDAATIAAGPRPAAAPRLVVPPADVSRTTLPAAQTLPSSGIQAQPFHGTEIQQVSAQELVDDAASRPFPVMAADIEPAIEISANKVTAALPPDITPTSESAPSSMPVTASAPAAAGVAVSVLAARPVGGEIAEATTVISTEDTTKPEPFVRQTQAASLTSDEFVSAIEGPSPPPLPLPRGRVPKQLPPSTSGELAAAHAASMSLSPTAADSAPSPFPTADLKSIEEAGPLPQAMPQPEPAFRPTSSGTNLLPAPSPGMMHRSSLPTPSSLPPIDARELLKPDHDGSGSTPGPRPTQTSDRWQIDQIPVLR